MLPIKRGHDFAGVKIRERHDLHLREAKFLLDLRRNRPPLGIVDAAAQYGRDFDLYLYFIRPHDQFRDAGFPSGRTTVHGCARNAGKDGIANAAHCRIDLRQ
jgi:hypothetical protein